MNIDGFIALCQPSHDDLYSWLTSEMKEYFGEDKMVSKDGYLVCEGSVPIMLCAHLDTVHNEQITKPVINTLGNISAKEGIGGDDRCGVYAVLSILKSLGSDKKPWLFFSTDEETGGATTKKCAKALVDKVAPVKFLLAFDRKGKNDSVYYSCNNKDFQTFIDSHGFKKDTGSFTDICTLSSEWGMASVNLSVGYYNPHTTTEYVVPGELDATIDKALKIIEDYDGRDFPHMSVIVLPDGAGTYKHVSPFLIGDKVRVKNFVSGSTELCVYKDRNIPILSGAVGHVVSTSGYSVRVEFISGTRDCSETAKGLWVDEYDLNLVVDKGFYSSSRK